MADFKHDVPVTGAGQPSYTTCWYASYKMLFRFQKRNTNEVESKLRGSGFDFDDAMAKGMLDTKYKDAAAALGLTVWAGSAFNLKPSWYDVGLSDGANAFIDELKKGPLWVSRKAGDEYHIVVAKGLDDWDGKIVYNNPYPGPTDAREMRLDANLFVRNITGATGSVQAFR